MSKVSAGPEQWEAVALTSTETKVNHSLVSLHPYRTVCKVFEEKETERRDVVFSQLKDNIYAERQVHARITYGST